MGPFETERLILRNMTPPDIPALTQLIYSDREVWGQYSGLGDEPALLEKAFANHVSQDKDADRSVRLQKRLGFDVYENGDAGAPGGPGWVSVLNNPLTA